MKETLIKINDGTNSVSIEIAEGKIALLNEYQESEFLFEGPYTKKTISKWLKILDLMKDSLIEARNSLVIEDLIAFKEKRNSVRSILD